MDSCASYHTISTTVANNHGGDCRVFSSKAGVSSSLSFGSRDGKPLHRPQSSLFSFGPQNNAKVFSTPEFARITECTTSRGQPVVAGLPSRGFLRNERVHTPLELRTSAGNFLSGILRNQRHLFQFAVAEQLEQLAFNKNEAVDLNERCSTESILQRRIAEVKEKECQLAVEDVIYVSIAQKFTEMKVHMVPRLSLCMKESKLDISASHCKELESVHMIELQEMIREHLSTIIMSKGGSVMNKTTTHIHRLHLGKIYAASIVYGYFLKSASLRHRLDSSLDPSPENFHAGDELYSPIAKVQTNGLESQAILGQSTDKQPTSLCQELHMCNSKLKKLRSYVKGFDSETLQRCSHLKSKEAVNIVEKHTWALFGDESIGEPNWDSEIEVTFSSLEGLVLEAVAFGSFLWDVERYVDSVYKLQEN